MASTFSLGVLDINRKINGKCNGVFSQSSNSIWKKVAGNGNEIFELEVKETLIKHLV
jgi:hypothetical protein